MIFELIDECRREITSQFAQASDGYNYRSRTRVERCLFLVAAAFSRDILGYQLDGLTPGHQTQFVGATGPRIPEARVLAEAFVCQSLLLSLSPTHPSSRGNETIAKTLQKAALARNLVDRVFLLCDSIEAILATREGHGTGLHTPLGPC